MSSHGVRRRGLVLATVLSLALLSAACSGGDEENGMSGADAASDSDGGAQMGGGGGARGSIGAAADHESESFALSDTATAYDASGGAVPRAAQADPLTTPERVIKTAELGIEVDDGKLGDALREGRAIAEEAGGFLLSTSIEGTDRRSGDFTIRVPAERFEETLSALEDLGKITREDVRGEDVSQEFVDLEARLRNATAQEEVLFRLYDRSQSIADTIRVQRELEDVQLEIERLRGRLRYLEDRTDLSTITVSVAESGAVVAEAGPFEKAWDTARKTFVAVVSGVIVGAGFLLPLLAFALVAYVIFRLVRPRLQRATP